SSSSGSAPGTPSTTPPPTVARPASARSRRGGSAASVRPTPRSVPRWPRPPSPPPAHSATTWTKSSCNTERGPPQGRIAVITCRSGSMSSVRTSANPASSSVAQEDDVERPLGKRIGEEIAAGEVEALDVPEPVRLGDVVDGVRQVEEHDARGTLPQELPRVEPRPAAHVQHARRGRGTRERESDAALDLFT